MKNGRNIRKAISASHIPVILRRISALVRAGRYHEISIGTMSFSIYYESAYAFNQKAYSAWLTAA